MAFGVPKSALLPCLLLCALLEVVAVSGDNAAKQAPGVEGSVIAVMPEDQMMSDGIEMEDEGKL